MKKTFEKPELIIICFEDNDIIRTSSAGPDAALYGENGDDFRDSE